MVLVLMSAASLRAAPINDPISLPIDPDLPRRITQARKYIEKQSWPQAIRLLQTVLDMDDDVFIKEENKVVSARALANNLLGELPAAGRADYERLVGLEARQLLEQGQKNNDLGLLAQASRKYLHTVAGSHALELLGTHHLDRGETSIAALQFAKLVQVRRQALEPRTLVKALIAFRRSGLEAEAHTAWQALEAQSTNRAVKLGDRDVSLDDLKKELDRIRRESTGRDGSAVR
jgi:hypothetical protein